MVLGKQGIQKGRKGNVFFIWKVFNSRKLGGIYAHLASNVGMHILQQLNLLSISRSSLVSGNRLTEKKDHIYYFF